ncbi:MAG: hypothetical protein V2A78_03555, partial [bacterium]
ARKNIFRYGFIIFSIIGCVILGGIISHPSRADQRTKIGQKKSWKFVPTPEYNDASELQAMGCYEEARAKYREIANKNPGTPLAAQCQFAISSLLPDENMAIQELEDIVKRYPGTRDALAARGYIIDMKYHKDFDTWLKKNDELITSVGGKSIYEIIGLKPSTNRGSPQDIPEEYKYSVASTYGLVGASLVRYNLNYGADNLRANPSDPLYDPNYHGKNDPNKLEQAYKMLTYVRENFPTAPSCKADRTGIDEILSEWGFVGTEVDKTPPTIKTITPEYNNVYLIWRRPILRVFMYDGDINQSQIDLANLEFKLDGVDLKDKMKTKIVTLRPRSHRDAKKIVEKIFIWYRPEKPLTRGLHTILVNAKDYAGNSSSAMCTFKITTPSRKESGDVEEDDPSWIDRILKELKDK